MTLRINRRAFGLGAFATTLAAFTSRAASTSSRRFLFVHAVGGWDPLCVFAPLFSATNIDMEPNTAPVTVGNFSLVDSPGRPSVVPFFQRWGDRTLLMNGLSTRSVNHETCQVVALTGRTSDSATDWPTMLAVADTDRYYLPHLVLGGPAFAGEQTVYVSRAQGLVQEAINGDIFDAIDVPVNRPDAAAGREVDAYLLERATRFRGRPIPDTYHTALSRAHDLVSADVVHFPPAEDLRSQATSATRALSDGVARCVTIATDFAWDSHVDNSEQTMLFESLFSDLDYLMDLLGTTSSPDGGKLADDTVVVVLSEMGRTPAYNSTMGRDHWPYTSAMLVGPGVTGGRTVGGYTDLYAGIGVDPKSGDPDPKRPGIDANAFGATLLALGGLDPAELIPSGEILEGVLS